MSAPAPDPLAEQRSATLVPRATLRRQLGQCAVSAGVIHLDIVHFREVNERWGQAIGDSALELVIRRAVQAAPADAFVNDAGSTLTVVLPGATPDDTHAAAAELMTAIRSPI